MNNHENIGLDSNQKSQNFDKPVKAGDISVKTSDIPVKTSDISQDTRNFSLKWWFLGLIGILFFVAGVFIIVFGARLQHSHRPHFNSHQLEFWETITRDKILDDLDYLLHVLEENYPFFGVIYRRHGIDVRQHHAQFRAMIADESTCVSMANFWQLLIEEYFVPLRFAGHLFPTSQQQFIMFFSNPWNSRMAEMVASPAVQGFYGGYTEQERQVAHDWLQATNPGHITTQILDQENGIAYMQVPTMERLVDDYDIAAMSQFYNDIANFNHLIIDIRGNPGGWPDAFHELVTAPHLRSRLHYTTLVFYKAGEYTLHAFEDLWRIHPRPSHLNNAPFRVVDGNVLGRNDQVLLSDIGQFANNWYGLTYYHTTSGVIYHYRLRINGIRSEFSGQKWLLIDDGSASGAEHVAFVYKQNDFAILVGEPTAGVFAAPGVSSTFFALPNTGIIIRYDIGYAVCLATGHSIEEGILPHFENLIGMDALETTLALIESGAYHESHGSTMNKMSDLIRLPQMATGQGG